MSPGHCALSTGFLLPHPCPNAAVGACAKCGQPVCEQHAGLSSAGLLCRVCETGSELPFGLSGAEALLPAAGLTAAVAAFTAADLDAFEQAAPADEEPMDAFADLS